MASMHMHVTWRLNNDGRVQVFCPACKGCVLTVLLTNSQISFTHSSGNNVNCQYLRRTPLLVWLYLMFSRVLALRCDWTRGADPHLPLLERFKLIFHSPPPHATPCLSVHPFRAPGRRNREPLLLGRHSLLHTSHVHTVPTLTHWTRGNHSLLLRIPYTDSEPRHSPGCYLRLCTRTQGNEKQRLIVGREGSNRVSRARHVVTTNTLALRGCNAF